MLLIFNQDKHASHQPTSWPISLDLKYDVLNGTLVMSSSELHGMLNKINRIWQCIPQAYRYNTTGMIRFDCTPNFHGTIKDITWRGFAGIDLGELSLAGLYEINAHAPECVTGILRHRDYLVEQLASYHTPYGFLTPLIKNYFKSDHLCLLPGKNRGVVGVERICRELRKYNIQVDTIDEQSLFRHATPNLWRYGDLKNTDESEYSKELWDFLHHEYPHAYFNHAKNNDDDLSHKQLFTKAFDEEWTHFVGHNYNITVSTSAHLKQHKNDYVIKSYTGTRGYGVFIGKDLTQIEWENKTNEIVEKKLGYGAYESRFVPRLSLPDLGDYAFDINPCFWVENGQLSFLYANSRFNEYEVYKKNHVMNISQGAKLAGMILDPRFL